MLIFFILCYVSYIQMIFGNSVSSEIPIVQLNKKVLNESQFLDYNKTKSNLVNEGGSLLSSTAEDIKELPKDKHSVLLNLDKEFGKSKEKSVVARKGVVYTSLEDTQVSQNNTKLATPKVSTANKGSNISREKNDFYLKKLTGTHTNNKTTMISNTEEINEKEKHKIVLPKKPLVLSNEALDQITLKNSEVVYPKEGHNTKVPRNPNSHPGMIMPIVITILVVPMFAVIGYLAIKRGQEAWKNRHYKRMDFLLDGMYND